MRPVTDTQRRYLRAIAALTDGGRCTTFREAADRVGSAQAHGHLYRLQRKGLVAWEPMAGRTLRLTDAGRLEAAGRPVVDVVHVSRADLARIEAEWAQR
jgi:Mn-dependent DtxR family transcriptional regulator